MTLTDLLLIIVFLAVITYRVLKKKKDSKKEKQLDIIDINSHNKDTENNTIPVHRVHVQSIECNKFSGCICIPCCNYFEVQKDILSIPPFVEYISMIYGYNKDMLITKY